MNSIIHSPIGLFHLICAFIALITGTIVVLNTKGTGFHKKTGYVYVLSMLLLNFSAFGIYHLSGKFGVFHGLALVSLFSIVGGMYPVLFRHKVKDWMADHLTTMSWSVVGLYAAFIAETGVRFFPMKKFWIVVFLGSTLVCIVGSILINRRKKLHLSKKSNSNN